MGNLWVHRLQDVKDAGSQQVLVLLYPAQPEQPDDDVGDLVPVHSSPAIRVKGVKHPAQLVLRALKVLDIVGLSKVWCFYRG